MTAATVEYMHIFYPLGVLSVSYHFPMYQTVALYLSVAYIAVHKLAWNTNIDLK